MDRHSDVNPILRAVVSAGLAIFTAVSAYGQGNTGSIVGTILDASGASVPGAIVTASNDQNIRGYSATSDNSGYYSVVGIPVGTYQLTITKPGFVTVKQDGVSVTVGAQVSVAARLQIATTSTAVEVTETAISLDTTSSRTDTTINTKAFDTLAKGRTFNSILAIAPGVRSENKSATAGVGGIQVDGSSGLENSYYIEGISSADPISGALRAQNAVPLDFLNQLEVRTGGFEAELGGATGGVVTAVIKSGTNEYHGFGQIEATGNPLNASDRGYWQRSPLNANLADFFAPKKDDYSIYYPELVVGGPLVKNKLYFFAGYNPEIENTTRTIAYASGPRTFNQSFLRHYLVSKVDWNATNKIQVSPFVTYNTAASQAFQPVPGSVNFGNGYSNVTTTLGTIRDQTTRHTVNADLTYIASFLGQQHTFKGGYSFERIGENYLSDYTNGRFLAYWGQSFSRAQITNQTGTYGYYTWEDGVRVDSNVNGRNQGFYIQDSWRIHPRVTLNLGVRLENEFIPPYRNSYQGVPVDRPISFGWGDKIVPRLGGAWDILGDGRWKLSGSFGFFTDIIKYNLAQGSFGGQQWITHVYQLNNPNVFSLSKANPGALGPQITAYDNRTIDVVNGKWNGVDPDIKPFRSRDINFALEHQLASRLTASLRYTRKDILRAIEDIGVLDADGNEVYVIGNPGYGVTRDASSVYGQKTPNGQEFLVPKAIRQYDGVEFRIQGQIRNLTLIPSYTWSRLYGNYSGLGNSDESGRSNPNNNRSFDLPYYYFDQSARSAMCSGCSAPTHPYLQAVHELRPEIAAG